jgi:hypothetical protein
MSDANYFFVGIDKNIYLSTRSNLKHEHDPRINANAILCGQRDLDTNDINLITLLDEVNVSPTQIVNIMEQLKGRNGGSFLPKRVYDLSQKVEDLQDFANGLLPECNDAQKTIIKLENSSINHFYILHDDTGLYAISKGRPSTETVRMRLVCLSSINDQLESMRKDFILNDMEIAVEVKSSDRITSDHLKNLRELKKDYPKIKSRFIVSLEKQMRTTDDGIRILPYQEFIRRLWAGEII